MDSYGSIEKIYYRKLLNSTNTICILLSKNNKFKTRLKAHLSFFKSKFKQMFCESCMGANAVMSLLLFQFNSLISTTVIRKKLSITLLKNHIVSLLLHFTLPVPPPHKIFPRTLDYLLLKELASQWQSDRLPRSTVLDFSLL